MKKKLAVLFSLVVLALVGLVARITYINATSGSKYRKQVLSQAQQKYENQTLPAKRGDIYDRNGNILATSNKVYNVILDCLEVNKDEDSVEPTIKALVEVLVSIRLSRNRSPWMIRKPLRAMRIRGMTVS